MSEVYSYGSKVTSLDYNRREGRERERFWRLGDVRTFDRISVAYRLELWLCFIVVRCRLSASPATGLLGMQENVFLDNYFGCLGLLPLANER